MRARGRDKASRKRIWWRSEVSPILGSATRQNTYTRTDTVMVCWTVHPPSGNDSFLSLALTGLRLQALDLSLHLLPFCFNFYLFPSSSAFTPFFAYLCLRVLVLENWEIVGVQHTNRGKGSPTFGDAWTPRGSAHVASVPKLHD